MTICYLYPKELTLYGENGNIKALKHELNKRNIKTTFLEISKDMELDFKKYDFVYIGSGRPSFLEDVKKRLLPYKDDILDYINKDKIFLVTGNALSIFDFLGLYEINKYDERIVSDVIATTSLCENNIYGFQNTEYLIKSTTSVIFNIQNGYGNNGTYLEGYQKNNFYVTSLIGPILARNYKLNDYFINLLLNNTKEDANN